MNNNGKKTGKQMRNQIELDQTLIDTTLINDGGGFTRDSSQISI